jgi:putative phosphoesterase
MRIAVVSDIHGNLPALQAVVRDFQRRGVDTVFNLGDSLSGPLLPLQTAQFLMAQGWLHLAGNHERQVLTQGPAQWSAADAYAHAQLGEREFAWMASLRPILAYDDDIYLCHATPSSDLEYFLETVEPGGVRMASPQELQSRLAGVAAGLVLCGHTHRPRVMRSAAGQLLVNPGSVGLPAYDATRPYPHRMETGAPDARYGLIERLAGTWICSLISVPYPYRAMAELALERQRPDWGRALFSGFMV